MDFDKALAAHIEWKMKLTGYLSGTNHSLNPADVARDDKCELGQWIASQGSKYLTVPEFAAMKKAHMHFHATAADVVKRAAAGEKVTSDLVLGSRSEFAAASHAVAKAIMEMKDKIR
jgi:methyl-accepting chemotaxis protein